MREAQDDEAASWPIFQATDQCRHSLQRCQAIPSLMQDDWAENRLMDFSLWASGVGASGRSAASLDQRLVSQPAVGAVVLGLLSSLTKLIELCVELGKVMLEINYMSHS